MLTRTMAFGLALTVIAPAAIAQTSVPNAGGSFGSGFGAVPAPAGTAGGSPVFSTPPASTAGTATFTQAAPQFTPVTPQTMAPQSISGFPANGATGVTPGTAVADNIALQQAAQYNLWSAYMAQSTAATTAATNQANANPNAPPPDPAQWFINGANVTSIPSTGAGSAYFNSAAMNSMTPRPPAPLTADGTPARDPREPARISIYSVAGGRAALPDNAPTAPLPPPEDREPAAPPTVPVAVVAVPVPTAAPTAATPGQITPQVQPVLPGQVGAVPQVVPGQSATVPQAQPIAPAQTTIAPAQSTNAAPVAPATSPVPTTTAPVAAPVPPAR